MSTNRSHAQPRPKTSRRRSSPSSGRRCCRRGPSPPGRVEWELDEIFRGWICAGHASQVAAPGSYVAREIGTDSVVVIGGGRAAPTPSTTCAVTAAPGIVEDAEGSVRRRLRCPYHAWSYDLDGKLQAAPHMDGVEDFDTSCCGLVPIRAATIGGLVLVDLSGEAPAPRSTSATWPPTSSATATPSLAPRPASIEYGVDANWKGIAENYSECLHCPGVHPELNALCDYMSGEEV